MLTEEEEKFIASWEINRQRKKKWLWQLSVGLPLSVVLVVAIFANFFSGWNKQADTAIRSSTSMVLVLIIACLLIVVFTTVFSVKHKWDLNEQHYKELMAKKDKP